MLNNIFKNSRKSTLILGVHGLSNKPPKRLLTKWWKKSIKEGLFKIENIPTSFRFEMVYWADLLYEEPLRPHIKDPYHPLFIDEPYLSERELKTPRPINIWRKCKGFVQHLKELVFLGKFGLNKFRIPFNLLVKRAFSDLDTYYNEDIPLDEKISKGLFKTLVRKRLKKTLRRHRKKNIIILAHSMGSIIAYDVLLQLGNEINIKGFIVFGSPLGLPLIRENIMLENDLVIENEPYPPMPESIENCYSFSDKGDNLAAFFNLNKFYTPNSKGVKPIGMMVNNDYKSYITGNAHKSFGYLRTSEMSLALGNLLMEGRISLSEKGKQFFRRRIKK